MTDRMSNVEIEDVLSSIRRLVSDELRPLASARTAPPRLVLTEALRVDREPLRPAAVVADLPVELPTLAEAEEPLNLPDLVPDLLSDLADLPPEPAAPLPDPEDRWRDAELATRLAELEQLLDVQDQPFEPELGEAAGDLPPPGSWPSPAEEVPAPEAPFFSDDDSLDGGAAAEGGRLDWTEPAPQDAMDPAVGLAGDAARDSDPAAYRLLDESILRELIRDVLREELQGVLGQRVTRNLRKMVRSELGRTLATRGMT